MSNLKIRAVSWWLAFSSGIVLTANFSLAPSLDNAPRLLDVLMLLYATITIWNLFRRRFSRKMLWLIIATSFFLVYALYGALQSDTSLVIAALRFAVALLAIPTLGHVVSKDRALIAFLLGGAIGAAIVGGIGLGQRLNLDDIFFFFIPANTPDWWGPGETLRAVGIWQHPNALSQIQSIGAAMALSLTWRKGFRAAGYMLFFVIVGLTYYVTGTRAGIVAAVITFLLIHFKHPNKRYLIGALVGSWPLIAVTIPLVPRLFIDRWTGSTASGMTLRDNLWERLATSWNSFDAIFSHPLGLGFEGRLALLREINSGIAASHNGYLSFGLTFGLLPMAIFLAFVTRRLFTGGQNLLYPTTVVVIFLLLAEDSIFSPSVNLTILLCLLGGYKYFGYRIKKPGTSMDFVQTGKARKNF